MKKILQVSLIILLVFILSGCVTSKNKTLTDGGVFKSVDSGETWEQKIFVSQDKKTTKTIGNVSTLFIKFDPIDKEKIYLSSHGSGVFRTTNGGRQWQPTTLGSGTYVDLSIDSRNTGVIYATAGGSIIKSVDDMNNWHTIYVETRPKYTLVSVIVDYYDPSTIYAATTQGLLKSADYGNKWKSLDWDVSTQGGINKIFLSKKRTGNLYVVTSKGLIYNTKNDGEDWEALYEGIIKEEIKGKIRREKLSLAIRDIYFDPLTEYFYLTTDYGIVKSFDGGTSWQAVETIIPFNNRIIEYATYDPTNTNNIFFSVKNVLYKSRDGGKTWKTLKSVKTSRTINFILINPKNHKTMYIGTYKAPKK